MNKGRFKKGNKPWNTGTKGALVAWNKGKIGYKSGEKHWTFRKPRKLETRQKISKSLKGRYNGKDSPLWKGGYARKLWSNNQRRIIKLGNGGNHTLEEWENLKAQYNWICLCCKRQEPEITLSEDHVIPLSRGGSHNIENIQPLCRSCNSKKHTKITKYE